MRGVPYWLGIHLRF